MYFLFAQQGSYTAPEIIGEFDPISGDPTWRMLLKQNALVLEDADAVCETIALTIGLGEGTIDLDEGIEHLKEIGTDSSTTTAVGKALATVAASAPGKTAVASGALPVASGSDSVSTL